MFVIVLATASSRKEAQRIAKIIVKEKLAACASIISTVESYFRWKGRIDRAKETMLVIKTRKRLAAKLIKRIKSLHSYQVPEIIALPIICGYKKYLEWINDATG